MKSLITLFLLTLGLTQSFAAQGCPKFQCAALNQCSTPQNGGLNADGPGKFSALTVNPNGDPINGYKDCCQSCQLFAPVCSYWTHAIQDNGEEICYLYTSQICEASSGQQYTPCQEEDMQFTGKNMTTGSVCFDYASDPIGVEGDPHYTGADGSRFDFTGLPNKTYCAISDSHFHINVFHGGRFDRWGDNPKKPLTWIRKVGILWGHHTILFSAREGPEWRYNNGYVSEILVDGEPIKLFSAGDLESFFGGRLEISWVSAKEKSGDDEIDVYEVHILDVMRLTLRVRPEISLLRTSEDGVVHFGLELTEVSVTPKVHGVLGQTYRPDHSKRLKSQKLVYSDLLKHDVVPGENGEGFLDGSAEDYETSSIFSADCTFSRFARAEKVDFETAQAIELNSKKTSVESVVVGKVGIARKLLGI